ncbi:hypothetical protein OKW49_006434 [Paraburkholderia youngii]|uniref:hypothetical protein n=1 Tax=Paraburkholderia youngii TaxID=2782701 RepID=UPI003D1B24EA
MNSPRLPQYAVGRWESLWASHPYMSHRILIDLRARKVAAGEHRYYKAWHYMSMRDLKCMQQILGETFDDIFDDPAEYEFEVVAEPPVWALMAWPWPRIPALTDDEENAQDGDD